MKNTMYERGMYPRYDMIFQKDRTSIEKYLTVGD
jgi:hypothetical protein